MSKIILGIQLKNRVDDAPDFQSVLSGYGSIIQTRIGLHGSACDNDPASGVILLDFIESPGAALEKLKKDLSKFSNIEVQQMVF